MMLFRKYCNTSCGLYPSWIFRINAWLFSPVTSKRHWRQGSRVFLEAYPKRFSLNSCFTFLPTRPVFYFLINKHNMIADLFHLFHTMGAKDNSASFFCSLNISSFIKLAFTGSSPLKGSSKMIRLSCSTVVTNCSFWLMPLLRSCTFLFHCFPFQDVGTRILFFPWLPSCSVLSAGLNTRPAHRSSSSYTALFPRAYSLCV